MKSILLASASIVAFAGAAAAEVSFGGSAEFGYNDGATDPENAGFFWSTDLSLDLTQELDNGLTAGISFGIDLNDDDEGDGSGQPLSSSDFVLSLTSEDSGLFFGNTDFAPQRHWESAGEMQADDCSEQDGELVLRGDITFGGVNASVSGVLDDSRDNLEQLAVGADATFGNFNVRLGWQDATNYAGESGDFNPNQVFGISVGTSFAGADVRVAYAQEDEGGDSINSTGIEVSYPVGPVTLGAYYVMESDDNNAYGISADYASGPITVSVNYEDTDEGEEDWSIEGTYDVGNGITALAGITDAGEDFYVAGEVGLGSGSTLTVSFADDGDGDAEDEIGDPEYLNGTTVEITFEF